MESVKFFCDNKPTLRTVVQVVFITRHESHASGKLIDYEGEIIMPYSKASKKKKIKSVQKLVPLNRVMYAILEDFDFEKNLGIVSRSYINDIDDDYSEIFEQNNKLKNGIYQICTHNDIDFKTFWENQLFPLISQTEDSYLECFMDNYQDLDIDENIKIFIKKKFQYTNIGKELEKIKVGIISMNGIDNTKLLLSNTLEHSDICDYKDSIEIKYLGTPYYIVETYKSNELLQEFVKILQKESTKTEFNNSVFIQIC